MKIVVAMSQRIFYLLPCHKDTPTPTQRTMKNCTVITYTVDAPEYGSDCITEKNYWHTYPYNRPVITYRGAARILKNNGIDNARTVVGLQHMVRE